MDYVGINFLRRKLEKKQPRIEKRYNYYDMKVFVQDFGKTTPDDFKYLNEVLGWCSTAVDAVADRIVFKNFKNDLFGMNEIFEVNNQDVFVSDLILGSLISSCDFVYIYKGIDGFPKLEVIDGYNATGMIDRTTMLLNEGYAVLERDVNNKPIKEAYFTSTETIIYDKRYKEPLVVNNPTGYPLLVPIIYKPDAKRPFGHSRISRACMNIQQGAMRTLKRSEISAEYYSFPQKYVLGTDQESERLDRFRASIAMMLEITKDDDGDKPTVGQFQQQSMEPFISQMKMFASLFAGESGLTVDDLGFVSDNPSSQEAIKASHERLRLITRKAQSCFSVGLKNVGFLACCLRDNKSYKRYEIRKTKVKYEPIFEPDSSSLSMIGDGLFKINQAVPGYVGTETMEDLTGVKPSDDFNDSVDMSDDDDEI